MNKGMQIITAFVIGMLVAGAFVYGLYEAPGGIKERYGDQRYAQGRAAGQAAAVTYVPLSKVEFDITGSTTLNYTAEVNASDDVATRAWENTTISIKNKEDSGIAHLRLALRVPGEEDGLPDELEQEEFMVYITDASGTTTHYLFGDDDWDGEYHNYDFDLSASSSLTYTLATSMKACNDIFENGQSLSIEIYLWERDAGLNGQGAVIDSEKLTLET